MGLTDGTAWEKEHGVEGCKTGRFDSKQLYVMVAYKWAKSKVAKDKIANQGKAYCFKISRAVKPGQILAIVDKNTLSVTNVRVVCMTIDPEQTDLATKEIEWILEKI